MRTILLITLIIWGPVNLFAQNYTSTSDGVWTTGSNWGGTAPATSGQSWGTINANHNLTINSNYSFTGATLNVAANKQLVINGDLSIASGADINVYGTLTLTGNADLNANLRIFAGGRVSVGGNVTVRNSTYLTVGTNTAGPPYADLVVYGNLVSQSSGDVVVNRNGRVAVFGNLTDDGSGGTVFTINNGGQVYIDDGISFTGGGDRITNNNATSPYGLYVNGPVTNSGGGATTTTNQGDLTTLQSTNTPFYNWVTTNGLLPVTLLFFEANYSSGSVMIKWATATELNFEKFIVERGTDGKNFQEIGEVKGAGNTNIRQDYLLEDKQPLLGRTYYRLKAIDFDGYTEYFDVITVECSGDKTISLFPNPSDGKTVNILTNFLPSTADHIIIMNNLGVIICNYKISDIDNRIQITKDLEQGAYLLIYKNADQQFITRFSVK